MLEAGLRPIRVHRHASDDHLFVTHSDGNTVSVLDGHSGRTVWNVAVGRGPMGVAIAGI